MAAEELQHSHWPEVIPDLVQSLVDHYKTVFDDVAFDTNLLTGTAMTDRRGPMPKVLMPPEECPCISECPGVPHVVEVVKQLNKTELLIVLLLVCRPVPW